LLNFVSGMLRFNIMFYIRGLNYMKTVCLNPIKTSLVCALFLFLQSCGGPTVPGAFKNDKISSGKRDDFHQLNTQVLKVLKADDPKGMQPYLAKEMLGENIDRLVEHIGNRLTDNNYDLVDEYYVVHKFKDTDTVATTSGDVKRYRLLYPFKAKEMYMAYFAPKKPANKYMISLVYAKFDYGWKIVAMDVELYTINGKTAPELYKLAQDQFDKKEFQAALNNVSLAQTCWKPGLYWQYPDEVDAAAFYIKLRADVELKYHYPIVLKQLATGPMILRVYTKNADNDEGTYPYIYYMTHFDLKNTKEVEKENLQMRAVVAKLMPGLTDGNKYIYYSAFNKQPTGYVTVDHYDMVDEVK
jgi:hypothetical protein